jgi:hypothetical protein
MWSHGILGQKLIDIAGLGVSGAPLSAPSVDRVLINSVFRRHCDPSQAQPPHCTQNGEPSPGWAQVVGGEPLKICDSFLAPPRKSLEQQALAALVTVEHAYRMVKIQLPPGKTLSRLTILASPRFESQWSPWQENGTPSNLEMLFADNLAYFAPTTSTPPFLALLPTSNSSESNLILWESPFVVAHEYGHHVESVLGVNHYAAQRSLTRQAVSEGFADLIGFAAHGGFETDPLAGIPCIAADRSPMSANFIGGAAKEVTVTLLSQMGSANPKTIATSFFANCQGVLPYSPHGLGAVFAYWVRDLAKHTPNFAKDPNGNMIALAILWLQLTEARLGAGTHDALPAKEILAVADGLEAMVRQRFADQGQMITAETRVTLRQRMLLGFPGITNGQWFNH